MDLDLDRARTATRNSVADAFDHLAHRLRPNGHQTLPRRAAAAGGAVAGAVVMYLVDPARGRRRRARVRDEGVHLTRTAGTFTRAGARDSRNRARGLVARTRRLFRRDHPTDDVLTDRVRSQLGMVSRHPSSISVEASDGTVILRGPVLADEVDRVVRHVGRVRGVRQVENHMEVHQRPGDVPGLQGNSSGQPPMPPGPRPMFRQQVWSPTARIAAGAAGSGLAAAGLARRDLPGLAATGVGAALLARAATNLPVRRLTGVGTGRGAVQIQKSVNIDAPVEDIFAVWDDYSRFPTFMTHVRKVTVGADGKSHWWVEGPAGSTVEWDAETTRREPPSHLAWKTCPGPAVQHAGQVWLEPNEGGGTRVTVRISYNPVAGAVGHAVAALLGADPKRHLDDDLLRLKTLLETGTPAHDAARHPA